ncbi:MAG: sulfite exporter TauE/SafE family protein, partial [Gemmataceae bacterium]|nr:sulfite exporter TauE/SafE family protein [Gemmataceae bacterium]
MDANESLILATLAVVSFVLAFYGAAVGLILGHLRVPLLACILPAPVAASVNLAVGGIGALSGTAGHAHAGRVSLRVMLLMGVPSVVGGLVGAMLLLSVDPFWAKLFIGAFLVHSALGLLCAGEPKETAAGRGPALLPELLIGLFLGFLAPVTGLMMGSMRLPLMIRHLGLDPKVAVGTNMAVGCLTALCSSAVLMWQGGSAPLGLVVLLAVPTVVGAWLGSKWTGKMDKAALSRLVGWTVALAGVLMMGESLWRVRRAMVVRRSAQFLDVPRVVEQMHRSALVVGQR